MLTRNVLQDMGLPDDIGPVGPAVVAGLVSYLAKPDAFHITGTFMIFLPNICRIVTPAVIRAIGQYQRRSVVELSLSEV